MLLLMQTQLLLFVLLLVTFGLRLFMLLLTLLLSWLVLPKLLLLLNSTHSGKPAAGAAGPLHLCSACF